MLKMGSEGRCHDRGDGLTPMRQRQPVRELTGGLVGGLSVERHHRRRDAWNAAQLRTPAVADGRHLDVVRAPANGFLETMHGHWFGFGDGVERVEFYACCRGDQAKVMTKDACTCPAGAVRADSMKRKIFAVRFSTGFARVIHSFSTAAAVFAAGDA